MLCKCISNAIAILISFKILINSLYFVTFSDLQGAPAFKIIALTPTAICEREISYTLSRSTDTYYFVVIFLLNAQLSLFQLWYQFDFGLSGIALPSLFSIGFFCISDK